MCQHGQLQLRQLTLIVNKHKQQTVSATNRNWLFSHIQLYTGHESSSLSYHSYTMGFVVKISVHSMDYIFCSIAGIFKGIIAHNFYAVNFLTQFRLRMYYENWIPCSKMAPYSFQYNMTLIHWTPKTFFFGLLSYWAHRACALETSYCQRS